MQSGRFDHRAAVNVAARLETLGGQVIEAIAVIENVSLHGARVITRREFRPFDEVVLTEVHGDVSIDGKVIYCHHLTSDAYAVGLLFRRPITDLASAFASR